MNVPVGQCHVTSRLGSPKEEAVSRPLALFCSQDFDLAIILELPAATTAYHFIAQRITFNVNAVICDNMARGRLKLALDNEKGRNIKLEKQRKQERKARKRKEKNRPDEKDGESDEDGGVDLAPVAEDEANGKTKKSKGKANGAKATSAAAEPEWETEESESEDAGDDDDDMPQRNAVDFSRLEDSESDVSGDDEVAEEALGKSAAAADDDDEENEEADNSQDEDIPLSDIESLASEDRGDVIPHLLYTIHQKGY